MTLTYIAGDERPPWQPTISVNGTAEDYSTGHTFTVTLTRNGTTEVTKTTGIIGNNDGSVTVQWDPDELDIDPGTYTARLRIRRTVDTRDLTVETAITIRA